MKYIKIISLLILSWHLSAQNITYDTCFLIGQNEDMIESITQDQDGFIWVTGSDGFFRYDGVEMKEINPLEGISDEEIVGATYVRQRLSGDYWFLSKDNGAIILKDGKREVHRIQSIKDENGNPVQLRMNDVFFGSEFSTFITSSIGVLSVDPYGNLIDIYSPSDYLPEGFYTGGHFSDGVRTLILDPDDKGLAAMWLGGNAGLMRYFFKEDSMALYPTPYISPYRPKPAEHNFQIHNMYLYEEMLYLSNWGSGLLMYDKNTQKWNRAMYENDDGTNRRVIMDATRLNDQYFIGAQEQSIIYDMKSDSVSSLNCTTDSKYCNLSVNGIYLDHNQNLWLGHRIDPRVCKYKLDINTWKTPRKSKIYIHQLKINDVDLTAPLGIYDHQAYTRSEEIDTITIGIRAINHPNYNIKYQYRWGNNTSDWKSIPNELIKISEPAPGTYSFQGRYFDESSQEYVYTEKLKIYIPSPIWSNPIFIRSAILLLSGILLGLIAYVLYRRWKNIQEKRILEDNINEAKHLAMRAQMNPHFMFNSLNSIRYLFMKDRKEQGLKYITKFAKLLRSTLNHGEEALIPLADELELTELYIDLEQLRFEDQFTLVKDYEGVAWKSIPIPPFVLQPIVENAFWHGLSRSSNPSKRLHIIIKGDQEKVTVIVEDNGVGFDSPTESSDAELGKTKSFGINLIQDRFNLINKTQKKQYRVDIQKSIIYDSGARVVITVQ